MYRFKFLIPLLIFALILPSLTQGSVQPPCGANLLEPAPVTDPIEEIPKIEDPEFAPLDSDAQVRSDCEASSVCQTGQPVPKEYRILHRFLIKSAEQFTESVKSTSGKNLRARPVAMADFLKNMAIIWPGQLYGAMRVNGDLHSLSAASLAQGFGHLTPAQLMIAWNTLFMVWTQSDRGAATTQEVRLPRVRTWSEFFKTLGLAYHGEEGFIPEFKDRLYGFLTLIPVEIVHLTLLSTLVAVLPGGAGFGSPAHLAAIKNFGTFAFLFGTYLSFKWAGLSKVFDLRGLPILREWASAAWNEKKENAGLRWMERDDEGSEKVIDDISLFRLMTKDFFRFVRNKEFDCSMDDSCRFADDVAQQEQSPRVQYGRRWRAYWRFRREQGFVPTRAGMTNAAGLPIEMTYRYANSIFDGFFVMWLAEKGAPFVQQWLGGLF